MLQVPKPQTHNESVLRILSKYITGIDDHFTLSFKKYFKKINLSSLKIFKNNFTDNID